MRDCLDELGPSRRRRLRVPDVQRCDRGSVHRRAYGAREREAFARCRHPAMRCDYLRMCFVLAEGGLYVDADDVLLRDDWKDIFRRRQAEGAAVVLRHPCRRDGAGGRDLASRSADEGRIFYVNNDPIAAAAGHPVLRGGARRVRPTSCSARIRFPEIQSTTGPGNLTAALAAHAHNLNVAGAPLDFELLHNWEASRRRAGTSPIAAMPATGVTWTC